MFFTKNRKKSEEQAEAEIQAVRQDTLGAAKNAAKQARKVNKVLGKDDGITLLIFLATGGDRRR